MAIAAISNAHTSDALYRQFEAVAMSKSLIALFRTILRDSVVAFDCDFSARPNITRFNVTLHSALKRPFGTNNGKLCIPKVLTFDLTDKELITFTNNLPQEDQYRFNGLLPTSELWTYLKVSEDQLTISFYVKPDLLLGADMTPPRETKLQNVLASLSASAS
jgi:hypothetical protein